MTAAYRWIVLAIVSSALLLIVIDMTVLYTALPRLTEDLGATQSEKLWIVNAYALTVAGLLPAAGALGDRFGARGMFLSGLVVFGAASLLAAFAPTAGVLIAGRVALAVGAAMMMPATLAIIRHTFEDDDERSLAIGIWAAVASGGAAFGPILGGALLEVFWWGSVFLINVPIVAVALVFGLRVIERGTSGGGHPFSLGASVQIMIGLVATTLAIKELGKPAPSYIFAVAVGCVGVAFVAWFIQGQRKAVHPMLDLSLFRNPAFSTAALAAVISAAALMGLSLAMTQRFQLVLGMSPLEAGIHLLPLPLAAFVAGPVTGRILPAIGSRRMLPLAMWVIAGGLFVYLLDVDARYLQISALTLIGAGVGAAMTTASSAILHNAPAHAASTAASVEEVSYELGGALGVTIFGSLLIAIYSRTFHAPPSVADIGPSAEGIDQALIHLRTLDPAQAAALQAASADAFTTGFVAVLMVACVLVGLGAALIAVWTRRAPV